MQTDDAQKTKEEEKKKAAFVMPTTKAHTPPPPAHGSVGTALKEESDKEKKEKLALLEKAKAQKYEQEFFGGADRMDAGGEGGLSRPSRSSE